MIKNLFLAATAAVTQFLPGNAEAKELKANDAAPTFTVKTHEAKDFDMKSRKGQWTILYFYPKADTPGCTKQACAFRDSVDKIRAEGAEVYGVSIDSVEDQAKFHKKHHLNFPLLADADGKISEAYKVKRPLINIAKRWTFVIDPELKIRTVFKDVDPVKDAAQTAAEVVRLKKEKK